MELPKDTLLIVPTKREPPIRTFVSYGLPVIPTMILADPDVYQAHRDWYSRYLVSVVLGEKGIGKQNWFAYRWAARAEYPWWFKLDDDLFPNTFVGIGKDEFYILEEAIIYARRCVDITQTTFAGFSNTTNRSWLSDEYKRTYGLIHGAANIACSTRDPQQFIDPTLCRSGDVYRSLAHRRKDKAVGRVGFIGFDKSLSTMATSVVASQEELDREKDMILQRFPGMVTCNGTRWIHSGTLEIANWRLQRGGCFEPNV